MVPMGRTANGKDDLAGIRRLYDREAARYDRIQEGRFMRWLLRGRREKAAPYAKGRLLEVGIGSGTTLALYQSGVQVTGIDISTGMLAIARTRLEQLGRDGDLREMDAQALDFPDHAFDSVAFNLCLCTIPDPARALREAIRVAKAGAPMTFLEHVRSDRMWVALPQDLLNVFSRSLHDRLNQRTEALVRAAGVEVLSVERWALGAMTLIIGRSPVRQP
jgi:ubiquinone/menaquinone biosynthesis C-methylase UbiE